MLSLLLILVLGGVALRSLRADLAYTPLDIEVGFWGRENYLPDAATRRRVDAALAALAAADSRDPDVLALRARQLAWEAWWSEDRARSRALSAQALDIQLAALALRPADGQGWRILLQYAPAGPAGESIREQAVSRLQALRRWH